MNPRTVKLFLILISIVLIRLLVFPEISRYIEFKSEKQNYERLLEETREEIKNIKKIEIETKELRNKIKEIQDFSLQDFEILSAEKKSENTECIKEDNLCFVKKAYEIKLSVKFDEIVSFFKEIHDSKSICSIKKIEIKRTSNEPETKVILEYWEWENKPENIKIIENSEEL